MEVSERERREMLASELADILYRQQAIVQCNEILNLTSSETQDEFLQAMVEEDEKNLRMIETVINSFGLRVAPKEMSKVMAGLLTSSVQNADFTPLEMMGLYILVKQNQMMCCHLVHKSAQVSAPDIKVALAPFAGVYASFSKHVAQLTVMMEKFGVEFITGEKPASGLFGRLRDAMATAAGAVLSKAGKPGDEMNVMTVLTMEHRKVDALFGEIEASGDFERALDLFTQLKADLTAHSIAEEDTVYAFFKQFADARENFEQAHDEHLKLRSLLDEISYLANKRDEDPFYEKVDDLRSVVRHHVNEEESKIFSLIRVHSDEATQIRLCQDFLAEKREIQLNVGLDDVVASVGDSRPEARTEMQPH